jgi:prepilin peptidase CpaA
MTLLQPVFLIAFPILVIVAALSDLTTFTIPNWISLLLVAAFVPAALMTGQPIGALGLAFAIGLAALIVGMGMFAMGWIGGGDAKLFAAAALWIGAPALLPFLMVTALAGGGLAVLLLNARSAWLKPYLSNAPAWLARLTTPGQAAPYGVAIAIGALAAFPQSPLMQAFHGNF